MLSIILISVINLNAQKLIELKKEKTAVYTLVQGKYVDNLRDGLWVFYKNNRVDKIANYKCGKLHGKALFLDSLDNVIKELNFEEGRLNGYSYFFNLNGDCVAVIEYINGIKNRVKLYRLDPFSPSKEHGYLPYSKDDFYLILYDKKINTLGRVELFVL